MTRKELIKLSRENLRKSKQGSLCECYDEAFIKGYQLSEKRIAELEQQVEKLTEDNVVMARQRAETAKQLTKAKELIEELSSSLSVVGECEEEECELLNRAEQFLKDSIE